MGYLKAALTKWGVNEKAAAEIIKTYSFTVAQLPDANANPFACLFVTDASATTFCATIGVSGKTVSGGGTNVVPVFADGKGNWRIG
jgi:hypothetical protein